MAQNVTIAGASYSDVPSITVPKQGGGSASFVDTSDADATAGDIASGKTAYVNGEKITGTGGGGGTETIIVPEQTITVSSAFTQITFSAPLVAGEQYTWTVNGTTSTGTAVNQYGSIVLYSITGCVFDYSAPNMYFDVTNSSYYGTYTIKVVQESGAGGSTLIEKSITANGVYNASDDSADGYSKVTVNVSGGTSLNTQVNHTTNRTNSTTLTSINSLTCSKAGKYDVYWTCTRSNTSQTWGSQLYINGTAYGSEQTSGWSNNVQTVKLTDVTIAANVTVAVYGRARSNSYYIYAPQLSIVQTA